MSLSRVLTTMLLILSTFMLPVALQATATAQSEKTHAGYKEITTDELKAAIDAHKDVHIFDARKTYKAGLIVGARGLPYDASESEIKKVLGSLPKDAMIVVYCANIDCPVSKYLAVKLVKMGYTNVYKYPEGISGWLSKGYPTDKA